MLSLKSGDKSIQIEHNMNIHESIQINYFFDIIDDIVKCILTSRLSSTLSITGHLGSLIFKGLYGFIMAILITL